MIYTHVTSRNLDQPVNDEIVRRWLNLDIALYSMWMPGDVTTAAIVVTALNPLCSYYEGIDLDDIAEACADYLLRMGAPTFRDAKLHTTYVKTLEGQLSHGTPPIEARDAALRALNLPPGGEWGLQEGIRPEHGPPA